MLTKGDWPKAVIR